MTPTATHTTYRDATLEEQDADVFHDLGIWIVMVLIAMLMMASLLGLAAIYYGDSMAVPSWNERSVPPGTTT
jgi:hypothetical protein